MGKRRLIAPSIKDSSLGLELQCFAVHLCALQSSLPEAELANIVQLYQRALEFGCESWLAESLAVQMRI